MLQLDGSDPSSEHFGWDIFLQEEQPNGIATEDISGKKRKSSAKQQKTYENHFDNFLSTKRVKHNIRVKPKLSSWVIRVVHDIN